MVPKEEGKWRGHKPKDRVGHRLSSWMTRLNMMGNPRKGSLVVNAVMGMARRVTPRHVPFPLPTGSLGGALEKCGCSHGLVPERGLHAQLSAAGGERLQKNTRQFGPDQKSARRV